MQKTKSKFLTFFLIVCLVTQAFLFWNPIYIVYASGEAWLSGWAYRKSHTINNATGAGTLYQMKVHVYYGSGTDSGEDVYCDSLCQTDFDDIRFTDNDGNTTLDYWLETKADSNNATFWVEIADSLETVAQTIYIYYGNAGATYPYLATDLAQGEATFLLFDNFEDASIDANKWTVIYTTPVEANGYLRVGGATNDKVRSTNSLGTSLRIMMKQRLASTTIHSAVGFQLADNTEYSIFFKVGGSTLYYLRDYDGSSQDTSITIPTINTWHLNKLLWKASTSSIFYIDDLLVATHTGATVPDLTTKVDFEANAGSNTDIEWAFVAKYVDPEPVHSTWGTLEGLTVNLSFVLGDRLTIPITTAYLKGLHAPVNDTLEIVTYEMLLKTLANNFAETFKPHLSFNFLKALTIPLGSTVSSSTFLIEYQKTIPFNPSDTVKPLGSLSTLLNIPTYLTSVVSGLVPIRDSSTMTKMWTNLFSETVRPNLNTILLKSILNPLENKLSTLGSSGYSKNLPIQFSETVKLDLTFNFLKALNIPFGSTVSTSTFLQYWKTIVFTSHDTVKPYASFSTSLDVRSFLTSIVSNLVPVRDSLTHTKTWINTFPQTLTPNMNEMLLKNILSPMGSQLSSLDSNGFSKTIFIQTSETFLLNFNALFLKAILNPLGSTVTIPTSIEATKAIIFKPSDFLKPFDYITMTIGVATIQVESFLGDLLNVQASLGATKNMLYLPDAVLKVVGGRFVPGLVPFEYPTASIAWAAAFIIVGLLIGLLLMSKRRDENGQET